MTNTIAVGSKVEYSREGEKSKVGVVLEVLERKARVQFEGEAEPESVFQKYLTVIGKAGKSATAPKVTKEKKEIKAPRPPRVAKALGVVPLVRQDGKDSKSIVAGADLSHYQLHTDVKTPSGRPTLDIGDTVASLLRGKTVDEVIAITAHKLTELTGETITQKALREKYEHLNPGQIRMNLGNRLRAAFRADEAAAE